MIGLPELRKSVMASRTSCTLPQSAAAPAGRITTLEIRRSTLAFRSVSTSDRTVGGASKNCPITPPGSISWRSPPTRNTRVELPETCGGRPTMTAINMSPAADATIAATMSTRTMPTPRLTATKCLLVRSCSVEYIGSRESGLGIGDSESRKNAEFGIRKEVGSG